MDKILDALKTPGLYIVAALVVTAFAADSRGMLDLLNSGNIPDDIGGLVVSALHLWFVALAIAVICLVGSLHLVVWVFEKCYEGDTANLMHHVSRKLSAIIVICILLLAFSDSVTQFADGGYLKRGAISTFIFVILILHAGILVDELSSLLVFICNPFSILLKENRPTSWKQLRFKTFYLTLLAVPVVHLWLR